jgi:probable HAF family extracellular repeat protein
MMSKFGIGARAACVLELLLLVAMPACQDHDPLAPVTPRHMRPTVSKTLSDGVAVASPVDMNTSGEVLGYLYTGAGYHAGISVSGVAYDLGTTDNVETTTAYPTAINNRGQVVGNEYSGGAYYYGFLWTPDQPNGTTGTITRLPESPTGPATALDINDAGQIVGIAGPAGIVVWNGTDMVSLPLPIAGGSVYWCTINQFGQIAGTAADANGVTHAFLWQPASPNGTTGSYVLLDAPGSTGGYAASLNDFGQLLVATYEGDAQLWTPASPNGQTGTWTAVTAPTGQLGAIDINSRGDVLGNGYVEYNYNCGPVYHLYLWRPPTPNATTGVTIDLTPDVGLDYYSCMAGGTFVSEEENATIQAFGYIYDVYGSYYDQTWTVPGLDKAQLLTASIVAVYGSSEGSDIAFEGRGTPFTPTLSYQWDFGDGASQAGRSVTHAYADNGQYTVRFTVTDNTGQSSTATTSVTVQNMAPTGSFVAPAQTNEGSSYVLRVNNVYDAAADLPTVQLALDCGDGRGYQSVAITGSLTCAAPNDALRSARARLSDKDGGVTEYTTQIAILDVAPTVSVVSAPAGIADKSTYTVSFKFTDPGLVDTWSYSVDWGDGTSSAPVSVATQGGTLSASHRYQIDRRGGNKSQTFGVTIRVSDNSGAIGTVTRTVLVTGSGAH